jgi:hypothetical protein
LQIRFPDEQQPEHCRLASSSRTLRSEWTIPNWKAGNAQKATDQVQTQRQKNLYVHSNFNFIFRLLTKQLFTVSSSRLKKVYFVLSKFFFLFLCRMGFKVMEFKLEQLTKLRVHPQTLHQLLSKEYLRVIQSPN